MFEALVERLLNKILGEYIEEFSAENLKIGIWSGEVVLKNIALKKSVIRKLNLPFRINYSKLGILRMTIPWKSLASSKIEVLLEGLELVVSEVPISEWDCKDSRIIEKRKQEIQSYCEAVLADFASRADKSKQKSDDGYFSKLVVKIIDNLQITIRDIHIRYEDELTKQFAFGITLQEFKLYTVNSKGEPEYVDRSRAEYADEPLRKNLELYNIGVYWNERAEFFNQGNYESKMNSTIAKRGQASFAHNYLILMTSKAYLLQRQPGKQFSFPEIDLQIALNDMKIEITNLQLQQIIGVAERLQAYTRKLKDSNRAKLSHEQIKQNREFFKKIFPSYFNEWGKNLSQADMQRLENILQKMEIQHFSKDIQSYLQDQERQRIIKQRKQKNKGWWFSKPKDLTNEELQQIENYLNNNFSQEVKVVTRPKDFYYINIGFKMQKFQISILNTLAIIKQGIQSCAEELQISFSLREGGYGLQMSLQSINVDMFKQIGVQPREYKRVLYKIHERTSRLQNAYLKMTVHGNPIQKPHLNTDIKLETSQLILAFDPKIISIATEFADIKLSNEYKEAAIQKFGQIKQATTTAVAQSIEKPKKLKIGVDVFVKSMTVVVPFSPYKQQGDCWGVNLGSVRLTSDQQASLRNQAEEGLPLDVFNMELIAFSFRHYSSPNELIQILSINAPFNNITNAVINNLDFKLQIEIYAQGTNTQPKLNVLAVLPSLEVNLNQFTYKNVLKLGEAFKTEGKQQSMRMTTRIEQKKEIQKKSVKIGFVYIKGTITKVWEKYVAIMSENYIYLYLNKNDKNYYAYYYIKGAKLQKFSDPLDKQKPFLFRIKNKVNEVVFGFDKEDQIEDWIVKINALNKKQQLQQELTASLAVQALGTMLQGTHVKRHNQLNLMLTAKIEEIDINVFTTQSVSEKVINLNFKRLISKVYLHESKTRVQLQLFSISLKDSIQHYKCKDLMYFLQTINGQNEQSLISIDVEQLNKDHSDYEKTDSTINISFGTLACNYKCETVKALMGFFIPPPAQPYLQQPQSAQFDSTSTVSTLETSSNAQEIYSLKLRLRIQQISVTLVNQKVKTVLGKLGIAQLRLYTGISQKRMALKGSLRNMYYIDCTNHPNTIYTEQENYDDFQRKIITANVGSEKNMLEFNIQMLKALNQSGKNLFVDTKLANLTIYFSLQPVLRLITYLNTQMLPSFETGPKEIKIIQAKDVKPQPATMDLKVELSNISVFVQTQKKSDKALQQYMKLNIAAITVGNQSIYCDYIKGSEKKPIILVQNYNVNLYAMSIAVHYFDIDGEEHQYKITNNMDIALSTHLIANPDYYKKELPNDFDNGMRVSCNMTPFFMTINHDDYNFIMKCLNWAITYNDGLDDILFDIPRNSIPQQNSKDNAPSKDPFYLKLRMECISLFITQESIPIAFLQQTNMTVDFSTVEELMQIRLTMDQLYGTSIQYNRQQKRLKERGIFNCLGYTAQHKVQEIRDMESYVQLFEKRGGLGGKDFLVFNMTMTDKAMNIQISMSQLCLDVDIKLLLILTNLANTDENYIKGPQPIQSLPSSNQLQEQKNSKNPPAKRMTLLFNLGKFISCVSDISKSKFFVVEGQVTFSMTTSGEKTIQDLDNILGRDSNETVPHSTMLASLKDLTLYFSKIKQGKTISRREFLQPMSIEFNQQRFYHLMKDVHMLSTDIQLKASQLALTASLKDMLNINTIVQDSLKILSDFNTQPKQSKIHIKKPEFQERDLERELMKIEQKIAREIQSKTKIMGQIAPMQIEIVNDIGRNFMPVLRLLVESTQPAMQQTVLSTEIFIVPIFSLYFFNPRSSRWQPIIQPFKASVGLTTITINQQTSTSLTLKTGGLQEQTSSLKINLSTQLYSTLLAAQQALSAEKESLQKGEIDDKQGQDIEVSPFVFHNITNENIYILRGDKDFLLPPLFKGPVRLQNDRQVIFRLRERQVKFSTDHYGVMKIADSGYYIKFDTERLNKVIKFMPKLIIRNRLKQAVTVRRWGKAEITLKVEKGQAVPLDGIESFAASINGTSYTERLNVGNVKLASFLIAQKKNFVILLRYKEPAGRFATLELLPPFVVYNCLPKGLNLQFLQKAKLKSTISINAQQSYSIFTAEDVCSMQLKATSPGFTWSKKFKYRPDAQGQNQLQLGDEDNSRSILNYRFVKQSSGQFVLTVYCKKFIVNQLKDKLLVYGNGQADQRLARRDEYRLVGGQKYLKDDFDQKIILLGEEIGNKLRVCGSHSQVDFATPIAVGGLGSSQARIVVDREREGNRESLFSYIGVEISAVRMNKQCDIYSKKIVLRSKVIFVNSTKHDVSIKEDSANKSLFFSEAGSRKSLVFSMPQVENKPATFTITIDGLRPSRSLLLPNQGTIHFRLHSLEEQKISYFRILIKQVGFYRFYELTEMTSDELPYEVVVKSESLRVHVPVLKRTVVRGDQCRFIGQDFGASEIGAKLEIIVGHADSKQEIKVLVQPDNLQFKQKLLISVIKGSLQGSVALQVSVTVRDKQRAIIIDEISRVQEPKEFQQSAISLEFSQIVLSINQNSEQVENPYESLVLTLRKLQLIKLQTDKRVQYQAKLHFLQIDQSYPHVIASPVILTPHRFEQYTREKDPKAIFNFTIVLSKQFVKNTFIKEISLDMGDLVATFSADFLALATSITSQFTQIANYKEESYLVTRKEQEWQNIQVPPEGNNAYIECIRIAPFVVDLTAELNLKKLNLQNNVFLTTILSTIGVMVSNIDSAPITMTGIEISDCIDSVDSITSRLISHYKTTCVSQFYKVVGSLNIIGNPLSLFRNISTGVKDLRQKPAKGFVNGPAEFGIGIVEGTTSLVAHSVGGAFNSIAKVTGTVSTGLATLAFDREFEEHREKERMKKPQNVIQGVAKGGKAIFYGFKEGITGVFTQPLENARKEGALGFVKGAAKGLAGLVVKPVTGIIDFASKTTEGIKNNALMFEDKARDSRMRHPRVFYSECFILKEYSLRDSQLFAILKKVDYENKCPNPVFVDAFEADKDRHFLILLLSGVAYLDGDARKLKWAIDFSEMQLENTHKKLVFKKKGKTGNFFNNYDVEIEADDVRGIVAEVILNLQRDRLQQ